MSAQAMAKSTRASLRRPPRSNSKATADSKRKPRVMNKDEADILYCEKHKHEPGKPLRDVLRKLGIDESEVGL
jgi:hypothetical protein